MKLNLVWSYFAFGLIASCAAFAETRDEVGEGLFFGRSTENMPVRGPEGNLVQDRYGDVKVVWCGPGKWMIYVDLNRCGFSRSRNQVCTEVPMSRTGPWSHTFVGGKHKLTNSSGGKQLIEPVGGGRYKITPLPGQSPVTIQQAARPLTNSELVDYCNR